MSGSIEIGVLVALCSFVLGWIGSEGYQFYKNSKDKRWH